VREHPGRLKGWRAGLVWLVIGVDLALVVARFVSLPLGPSTPPWAAVLILLMVASLGLVGALVVTRQRRNPVGWILWVAATLITAAIGGDLANYLATTDPVTAPWVVALAWVGGILFVPALGVVFIFVPLLFPDGHLLSPRWRWVAGLSVVGLVIAVLPSMFMPGQLASGAPIDNPLGIPGFQQLKGPLDAADLLLALVAFPLAIASSVIRYRRGTPIERQQLKWFAASVGATGTGLAMSIVFQGGPLGDVGWVLSLIGLTTVPIAIGIAILRYRLYDIDRIISRTIGYLIVTGILVAVFALAVLVFQAILAPMFGENPVAVAASTLIVAALFQPLRARVQRLVDRRFNRARYDAERTTAAFSQRLRDQVDLPSLIDDLDSTIRVSLAPTSSRVWLNEASPR
jgi:hypothetical protein